MPSASINVTCGGDVALAFTGNPYSERGRSLPGPSAAAMVPIVFGRMVHTRRLAAVVIAPIMADKSARIAAGVDPVLVICVAPDVIEAGLPGAAASVGSRNFVSIVAANALTTATRT